MEALRQRTAAAEGAAVNLRHIPVRSISGTPLNEDEDEDLRGGRRHRKRSRTHRKSKRHTKRSKRGCVSRRRA